MTKTKDPLTCPVTHPENDEFYDNPMDQRSGMLREDDHSMSDFDIDAEIESLLGPAEQEAASSTPKTDADKAYVHPGLAASLETFYEYSTKKEGAPPADEAHHVDETHYYEDERSPLEPEDSGEDDGFFHHHDAPQTDTSGNGASVGTSSSPTEPSDAEVPAEKKAGPPPMSGGADISDDDEDDDDDEEEEEEEDSEDQPMSLRDHLNEMRKRVFRAFLFALAGFGCCYPFAKQVSSFLLAPLTAAKPEGLPFIYTKPAEAFFTELKIAFVAGIFLASPLIFYQLWAFIAPGLYKEEKLYIVPIALFSALFFICGGTFCYFVVFPFAFEFFMSYNSEFLQAMLNISDSLTFVIQLLLAFGLVFELPLFVFFLARLGIVTADMMRRFRRYAVLIMFIVAAILTPPDVISQLLMAGPLLLLYELSILVAVAFGKKKAVKTDTDDEDADDEDARARA